ncbi:MAG: hypothetical protein ACRQFF_12740 [Sphaerochaeta sp.]
MKKEILQLEKVSVTHSLDEVNFSVKEGEIVGIIPINNLGLDQLKHVICDGYPIHYGFVTFNGNRVNDYMTSKAKRNNILLIGSDTTLIDSLKVYENLFVIRKGFSKHIINKKVLIQQTQMLLYSVGSDINPEATVGKLTQYDKVTIELIKAKIGYVKLVIIDYISSFLLTDEIIKLHSLIRRMSGDGMSFIYICNHHQEAFLICDRCYLMKEGRMIKNLLPHEMNDEVMNHFSYLFENQLTSEERKELYSGSISKIKECIIKNINYESLKDLTIEINKQETVVLLDSDNSIIENLVTLLKDDAEPNNGFITLNNTPIEKGDRRIAIIDKNYPADSLFLSMSAMDNILFCSDHKLKKIWLNKNIQRSIGTSLEKKLGKLVHKKDLYGLENDKLFEILLQKLLLQKPDLIVMIQPFTSLDMYQRLKNIEGLDLLKKNGTSMLLLTLSLSDTLQVANRLLIGERGTVTKEFTRNEFSNLSYLHGSLPK